MFVAPNRWMLVLTVAFAVAALAVILAVAVSGRHHVFVLVAVALQATSTILGALSSLTKSYAEISTAQVIINQGKDAPSAAAASGDPTTDP